MLSATAAAITVAVSLFSVSPAHADYRLTNWASIRDNRSIMATPNGDLWVLARSRDWIGEDNRLRLHRFNSQGVRRSIESTLAPRARDSDDYDKNGFAVGAMAVGPDGNNWVAIGDAPRRGQTTLFRLSPTGRKLSATRLPSRTVAISMAIGPDGRAWILSSGRDRVARVSARGRVDELRVKGAREMSQIVQGSNGDMWAVSRGLAVRIDSKLRIHRYRTADQGKYASVGIVRGIDGAIWITGPGTFQRITADGQLTSFSLEYPTLDGFPFFGESGPLGTVRFPMSMSLRPDGRIGFIAAVSVRSRAGVNSDLESLGTVSPDGFLDETKPTFSLIYVYNDAGWEKDPLLDNGRFGVNRLIVGPDGRMWTEGFLGAEEGIVNVSDDSMRFTPTPGRPTVVATQSSASSVLVKMTCAGSPGKFCSGSLRLKRGHKKTLARTKYALAVGDQIQLKLTTRNPLPAGRLTATCTSRDVPTGTLTNAYAVVKRGSSAGAR
ncbi:MAG: hypothetical protein HY827_04340 [Actinobacteria bacterium]|nr:hypothetical protein [Actinomycetota bacterium]